jgi:hypothetical protein
MCRSPWGPQELRWLGNILHTTGRLLVLTGMASRMRTARQDAYGNASPVWPPTTRESVATWG